MVNTELIAGVDSFVLFGVESTFGTKASTIATSLGLIQNFSSTQTRGAREHRGFVGSSGSDGQLPNKTTSGVAETGFTVDFTPLEWTWVEQVMGAVNAADGTAGTPFIYSFSANPLGVTFSYNKDNVTTDSNGFYQGTRFASLSVKAAVGEPVTCTLEGMPLTFTKSTTIESNVATPTGEIFNFSGATLELPDGSAISNIIDSIEITITRDVKRIPGLSAFEPQNSKYGQTELRVNFTLKYLDDTFLDDLRGSSTTIGDMTQNATLTVRFDSSDSNKFSEWKFTNVSFPDISEANELNDFINEGITGWAESLTVEETQAA